MSSQHHVAQPRNIVGLIQVSKCEDNITKALRTFYDSKITTVIVVDAEQTAAVYANEPLVANKAVRIFCERSIEGAERRLGEDACAHATHVLELPATFFHPARGLVDVLAGCSDARTHRQVAVAPRYYMPDEYVVVGSFYLLTHLMWTFFSLLSRWKSYRGSYAVLRRVTREVGTATICYDQPAAWRKMDVAHFCPIGSVSPFYNFYYMMTRESTGFWRWLFIFIYVRLASFPWFALARDPTQWRALLPVPLIIYWIVQTVVALIYAQHYYPGLSHAPLQAAILPMIAFPWFMLCIWAKLIWRGYQGTRPTMHWPSLDRPVLPGFDDQGPALRPQDTEAH
jgi:hypothetical protein